jgi:uncharacterized protein YydD (DUF2326 family)
MLVELIVDCKLGKVVQRELSPEEVQSWLKECERLEAEYQQLLLRCTKAELLKVIGYLERAKVLEAEGILDAGDVAELESEVERLRQEVQAGKKVGLLQSGV